MIKPVYSFSIVAALLAGSVMLAGSGMLAQGAAPAAASPDSAPATAPATSPATTAPTGRRGFGRGGGRGGGANLGPVPEIHAAIPDTLPGLLGKPIKWVSTGILVAPVSDETHKVQSIKDPTIAYVDGKWEIYATAHMDSPLSRNTFNMIHVDFTDWKDAPQAKLFYMDNNPNFAGYKCAPELTYFTPQKKWYFTFQTQPPVYSTSDTPADPNSWTKPQPFFAQGTPMPRLPIDFHMIGDGEYMYLFFTGDDGNFYRSRTLYADFPRGFGNPVIAMHGTTQTVFEAGFTYKIKGVDKFLTCVEAQGAGRYYRAYEADKLDGEWYPIDGFDTVQHPFAGRANISFEDGVTPGRAR